MNLLLSPILNFWGFGVLHAAPNPQWILEAYDTPLEDTQNWCPTKDPVLQLGCGQFQKWSFPSISLQFKQSFPSFGFLVKGNGLHHQLANLLITHIAHHRHSHIQRLLQKIESLLAQSESIPLQEQIILSWTGILGYLSLYISKSSPQSLDKLNTIVSRMVSKGLWEHSLQLAYSGRFPLDLLPKIGQQTLGTTSDRTLEVYQSPLEWSLQPRSLSPEEWIAYHVWALTGPIVLSIYVRQERVLLDQLQRVVFEGVSDKSMYVLLDQSQGSQLQFDDDRSQWTIHVASPLLFKWLVDLTWSILYDIRRTDTSFDRLQKVVEFWSNLNNDDQHSYALPFFLTPFLSFKSDEVAIWQSIYQSFNQADQLSHNLWNSLPILRFIWAENQWKKGFYQEAREGYEEYLNQKQPNKRLMVLSWIRLAELSYHQDSRSYRKSYVEEIKRHPSVTEGRRWLLIEPIWRFCSDWFVLPLPELVESLSALDKDVPNDSNLLLPFWRDLKKRCDRWSQLRLIPTRSLKEKIIFWQALKASKQEWMDDGDHIFQEWLQTGSWLIWKENLPHRSCASILKSQAQRRQQYQEVQRLWSEVLSGQDAPYILNCFQPEHEEELAAWLKIFPDWFHLLKPWVQQAFLLPLRQDLSGLVSVFQWLLKFQPVDSTEQKWADKLIEWYKTQLYEQDVSIWKEVWKRTPKHTGFDREIWTCLTGLWAYWRGWDTFQKDYPQLHPTCQALFKKTQYTYSEEQDIKVQILSSLNQTSSPEKGIWRLENRQEKRRD